MRKMVFVTGASGAVGGELLARMRASGWDALGVYHSNEARARQLADEWRQGPGTLQLQRADLSDAAQVNALLESLPPDYCPDVIVHLAAPPIEVAALHRTGWDAYARQIDGVLKPVVLLTQPLLGRMLRRGSGRVIGVLSAAIMGMPPRGFSAYATAKHALAGYLRSLAAEYAGRGIAANMVSPGPMKTGQLRNLPALLTDQMRSSIPGDTWISPAAVAGAIHWLATEAGAEVTGCNLPVAGGLTF